jgi:hypothetical protein
MTVLIPNESPTYSIRLTEYHNSLFPLRNDPSALAFTKTHKVGRTADHYRTYFAVELAGNDGPDGND